MDPTTFRILSREMTAGEVSGLDEVSNFPTSAFVNVNRSSWARFGIMRIGKATKLSVLVLLLSLSRP